MLSLINYSVEFVFVFLFWNRFHMEEVELSTAMDLWGHKLKGLIKRSTSLFIFIFLIIIKTNLFIYRHNLR